MAGVTPTITAVRVQERSASSSTLKRFVDLTLSMLMLVALSPLLALIALAVKLQDGGPILHRRRVVGCAGEFGALKFRSMRVDADEWLAARPELRREFEKNFKLAADPRVTPLGAWLRRTSADEIPQLFNVLCGEMSLVGPRMITRPELAKYGQHAAKLLTVKPGMTGLWQICGTPDAGYEERVRMDMEYIDNWSIALDLAILLRTPLRVIRGQGGI